MIDGRNFHFRLAYIGDCTLGLMQTAIVDTDGYSEAIWLATYTLDGSGVPQPTLSAFTINGDDDPAMGSSQALFTAGSTLLTNGSTSTLPEDGELKVVSVAVSRDRPTRRYQRAVSIGNLDGGGADVMKTCIVCALRHDGRYPRENVLTAGTGGEAFEITSEGLLR
jgi:hypothetical protein